jgi:hypothetical protein
MPRFKRFLVPLTFCVTFGVATSLSAQTVPAFGSAVTGTIDAGACQYDGIPCVFSDTQSAVSANGSLSDAFTGSSASAQAKLAQGSLSVAVSGISYFLTAYIPGVGQGYIPGSANASALIWDTLTFSGAAPGAAVTVTMSGTAYLEGDARLSVNADLLDMPQFGTIGAPASLLAGNLSQIITSSGAYSIQNTFAISNGVPMLLAIGVHAYAGVSGLSGPQDNIYPPPGNAWITDPFSLDLPAGVTFTSASGQLVAAVPEPETYAMLLAGLGLMGFVARRRKQQAA